MTSTAVVVALALASPTPTPDATPPGSAPPAGAPESESESDSDSDSESESEPDSGPAVAAPRPAPPPAESQKAPEGHALVVGGVALVCTSLAGYVAMIVGLGLGNSAESRIASQYAEEDIDRRRDLIERGTLGNRLAIGAGVSAAVLMATGIALIVVGRRRATRAQAGVGSLRVRF